MIRRKSKWKLKVALTLISIAVIGYVFLYSPANGLIEGYSVGDIFQLTVSPNFLIKCTLHDELQGTYADGRTVTLLGGDTIFNPLIKYDVVNRNTREKFTAFPSDIYLTCAVPTNTPTTVSGSFNVLVTAEDPSGKNIVIQTKTIPVSERTLQNNVKVKLPSYYIKQDEIDSKMPTGSGDYTSWVRVHVAPFLTFKIPAASSTSTFSGEDILTSYLVRIVKDVPVTQAAKGTQVSIQTFDPKTFQLPLASNKGFITIIGQVDYYTDGEGVPWIRLIDPAGAASNKIRFTSFSNTDNDKWTEFKLTLKLPITLSKGTWKIEMGSDQTSRGKSVRTIEVLEATATPKPTTDSSAGNTNTGGSSTGTGDTSIKIKFKYELNYNGEVVAGIIPEEGFNAVLKSLSLVDETRIGTQPLKEIKFEVLGYPNTAINPKANDLSVKGKVEIDGKSIDLSQLDFTVTKLNTKDTANIIHFAAVSLKPSTLESRIKTSIGDPTIAAKKADVTVTIDGTFTGTTASGKDISGSVENAFLKFTTFYGIIPAGERNYDTGGTCQGLTPEQCAAGGSSSGGDSGGSSSGGDPSIVTQIGDAIGDVIGGSSGSTTTCETDTTNCTITNPQTTQILPEGFDMTTVLLILLGILVLFIIIKLVKRKKQ